MMNYNITGSKKKEKKVLNISLNKFYTVDQCLDTLIEMVQGPCLQNQKVLAEGKFLKIVSEIMDQNEYRTDSPQKHRRNGLLIDTVN